jgi:hypothetical protein
VSQWVSADVDATPSLPLLFEKYHAEASQERQLLLEALAESNRLLNSRVRLFSMSMCKNSCPVALTPIGHSWSYLAFR